MRQPLDPLCLRHLVANFADSTVGAVTGQLHLVRGDTGEQADMDLYWRYEIWSRERHSTIDSLFTATGCIYAMRRTLAAPLPPDTLSDDAILPLRAFFRGYRVIFDPAAIAFDYPAIAGTEFRRRFRTLAGLWQVHARLPELFTSRNRMRFHFLSHKFARLMLPWLILIFFTAAILLPGSWFRTWLLGAGAAWLLLALCNGFVSSQPTETPDLSGPDLSGDECGGAGGDRRFFRIARQILDPNSSPGVRRSGGSLRPLNPGSRSSVSATAAESRNPVTETDFPSSTDRIRDRARNPVLCLSGDESATTR